MGVTRLLPRLGLVLSLLTCTAASADESARFDELAHEALLDEIEQAKRLLREPSVDAALRAEVLMRLGVGYQEMAAWEWLRDVEAHQAQQELCFDEGREGCEDLEFVPEGSEPYRRQALTTLQGLLANHPTADGLDEALFRTAVLLQELGRTKEALRQYEELARQHQTSELVPDAYVAMGEIHFDRGNAYRALQAYKRAASFEEAEVALYARYKLGWCYFNVDDLDAAVDEMQAVIEASGRGATGALDFADEARDALVQFVATTDGLEWALDVLQPFAGEPEYRAMLALLADRRLDAGANEDAIALYRAVIVQDPTHPDNPAHQATIFTALWQRDRFDDGAAEADLLADEYGSGSRWAAANADDEDALQRADELIERALRRTAVEAHERALKRKSKPLLLLAEVRYDRYLAVRSGDPQAVEMRYWHAETLYKLRRYDRAADAYGQVLAYDPAGRFALDAASSEIHAIEYHRQATDPRREDEVLRLVERQGSGVAVPLTEWEARQVASCDRFVEHFPHRPEAVQVRYNAAFLLDSRNHLDEASRRYEQVITAAPGSETAQLAIHRTLAILEVLGDWSGLRRLAAQWAGDPVIGAQEAFSDELARIHENATVKLAEVAAAEAEASGAPADYRAAAQAYLVFYEDYPGAAAGPVALYNAAVHAWSAGDRARSLDLRRRFVDELAHRAGEPQVAERQLLAKTLAVLAEHHDTVADLEGAVDFYRRLVQRDPSFAAEGFVSADTALLRAARYGLALGHFEQAAADYQSWIDAHPDDPTVPGVRLQVAEALLRAGQDEAAVESLARIHDDPRTAALDPDLIVFAHKRIGEIRRDQGHAAEARQAWRQGIAAYERLAAGSAALDRATVDSAEMRLSLLEYELQEYDALNLSHEEARGRRDLQRKQARMQQLKQQYLSVAVDEAAGPWSIAAAFLAGQVVLDLYDDLMAAECPAALTAAQCQQYIEGLQIWAYENCLDPTLIAYREVLDRAAAAGLYTEYTVRIRETLAELVPQEYPPAAEILPAPDFASPLWSTEGYAR